MGLSPLGKGRKELRSTLKMTAKNRVTLRTELLGTDAPADARATRPLACITNFVGCLHDPGRAGLSLAEIAEVARHGWAGEGSGSEVVTEDPNP